jgi:hypothetical protein
MAKYKLAPGVVAYTDLAQGITLAPGEIKEIPNPGWRTRLAIKGKALILVEDPSLTPEPEPQEEIEPEPQEEIDPLLSLTRKKIMAEFSYLDDEDTEKAEKCSTKDELVKFLRSVEGDYK